MDPEIQRRLEQLEEDTGELKTAVSSLETQVGSLHSTVAFLLGKLAEKTAS